MQKSILVVNLLFFVDLIIQEKHMFHVVNHLFNDFDVNIDETQSEFANNVSKMIFSTKIDLNNMSISLIKDGCVSVVFQFDKQLGREYKGGLYPFFNRGKSNVFKVCDYIIFSKKNGKIYALVIESKN